MKRGLVTFDQAETPASVFAGRLDGLRDGLRAQGAAVGLVYGDVSRSGDLAYLTNMCLYWNEAVLAVPVDGPPALMMKLSKRVQPWIERTTILDDIRSGPKLAANIAQFVQDRAGTPSPRVAAADFDWWPAGLAQQMTEALPGEAVVDWPHAVRERRMMPDAHALALAGRAVASLDAAIDGAWRDATGDDDRTAITVRDSRKAGFMDVDVRSATLPDGSGCSEAVGQFRYAWVRIARARGGAAADRLNRTMDAVRSTIGPGLRESDIRQLALDSLGAGDDAAFEVLPHTDLETRGQFRDREAAERPFQVGDVVAPRLSLALGGRVAAVADMLMVTGDGARPVMA